MTRWQKKIVQNIWGQLVALWNTKSHDCAQGIGGNF
jgi:hypothetical protein